MRRPEMDPTLQIVLQARYDFRQLLQEVEAAGGLTMDAYARYLSMQYHLTKGCQRPFLAIAGHPDLGRRRALRRFIVNFANEEEFHFEIAARDLANCQRELLPVPFDVELWWAYFDKVTPERPFVRLGATCVLENIGTGCRDVVGRLFSKADFIRQDNTLFLRIHQHEELPHGDQIVDALNESSLEPRHYQDLREGAEKASVLYQRMARWALEPVLAGTPVGQLSVG